MQFFRHLLFFFGAQVGAQRQCMRVRAHRELFHFLQKRLQRCRLIGQLLVVPRSRRESRQPQLVRQIHPGIVRGLVDIGREIEDLRQQHYSINVDREFVFEQIGQHRRPRRSVALAKDELRRVPPPILRNESLNKSRIRVRVAINAPECLFRILSHQLSKASARRVDKHQVAHIEQGIRIVDHGVWRCRQMRVACRHNMLGPSDPICSHTVELPGPPL